MNNNDDIDDVLSVDVNDSTDGSDLAECPAATDWQHKFTAVGTAKHKGKLVKVTIRGTLDLALCDPEFE